MSISLFWGFDNHGLLAIRREARVILCVCLNVFSGGAQAGGYQFGGVLANEELNALALRAVNVHTDERAVNHLLDSGNGYFRDTVL